MKEQITNISIHFQGTAKGKRKIVFQSERIDQLQGHVTLTPEDFNSYERKAWALIDSLGYKKAARASLNVNFGHNEDNMTMVELFAKQKQLVLR